MNLLRCLIFIVALGCSGGLPFMLSSHVPALASQLLLNGGFEQDSLDPWKVYGDTVVLSRTPSQKRTGTYSAALTSNSASDKWLYQTVAAVAGSGYLLSGYILKNDPQVASVSFRIAWYASTDGTGPELYGSSASEPLTSDSPEFRLLTVAATAPFNARSARILGTLHPLSTSAGTVYFDDLSLEGEAPTPPPSPTFTPSPRPAATPSPTATATPIPTATLSPVPTATPSPTPAATWTPSPTTTSSPGVPTSAPTPTGEPSPTATALPGADLLPTPTPEGGMPVAAGDAKLLLSEVLVDPTGGLEASSEWVELFNAGAQTVDTGGWTLSDNLVAVTLPASALAPGSYLVIVGDSLRFTELHPGFVASLVQSTGGRIGNGLSNQADMVVLRDPSGQIRDSVNWGPPQATWPNYHSVLWNPGLRPPLSGQSLARVAGRDSSLSSAAWTTSLTPSPGGANPSTVPAPTASATAAVTVAPSLTATRTQTPRPNVSQTPGVVATPVAPVRLPEAPTAGAALSAIPLPALPATGNISTIGAPAIPSPTSSVAALAPNSSQTPLPLPLAENAPANAPASLIQPAAPAGDLQRKQATPGRAPGREALLDEFREEIPEVGVEALPILFIILPSLGLIFLLKERFFS